MATENLVSITISPEDQGKIDAAVTELVTVLKPLLISLTTDQRRELPKMGDGTSPFVEKSLDYARSNPEFAPPYMSVAEMATDLEAVERLLAVYRPLRQLLQQLDDSIMLSGSEAYVASLAYYNSVKMASKMNIPGSKVIFDDLKSRFVRASRFIEEREPVA